ncbi:uncharacterized protein LOC108908551 isoform X2 [Anoplophora glabripennis]|uniref:uncharacterized protein LOC108908551 isoform X2 n=1 Tax=Anoplophora glabripennis TaxID=217634 RepID=UPI0008752137|nr:uncharacterized protein LOC108908551 isoform X2 [Anoplophora glabripennis]
MEIDDRQASQIHGIISSDSDSDYNSREFDEEYYSLKPPPLEYESIKDKIVIVSRKQIVNAWMERLENSEKNNEEKTKSVGNVTLVTKTKKKKKSKSKTVSNVESSGIAAVSNDKVNNEFSELKECVEDEIHNKPGTSAVVSNEASRYVILPDLPKKVAQKMLKDNAQKQVFNSLSNESLGSFVSTKKKEATKINSPKIFYDSDTLKKVEEKLSGLENVWHSGLSDKIVLQEQNLQRQKESEMYEFWMKSARMAVKPEQSLKKEGKTVKNNGKTKNESKALVVETQSTDLPKSIKKIKKEAAEKEKMQINSNSKKNYMQELNLQCQKETGGTNLPKSNKKIKKEAAEQEKTQISSNSKNNNTEELNLQCQKEIDMYDFWMKLAGVNVKQKKNVEKEEKTVKNNEDTEKKSKKLVVESQVTNVLVHDKEVEKGSAEKKKNEVSNNSRENDAQYSNSRLLEKETMEQVWHLNNYVNNQITAASYGIESPTRINYETEKVNTIIKAKKKMKRKKKTKQADDVSVNQSLMNEAGNDEVISLENVTNKAEGNSLVHTGPNETIEMSRNEEKYNPELLDIDLVERIWFLPDNVHNKLQYITEIQAAAVGEIKTKRKRKKKSKQLVVESGSVNQPENVKDIKKEEAQIIENFKETSMEISNSRLLDTKTTGNLWYFDNIVDNQIQWFTTLSNGIESDPRNNNEIEETSTAIKTKKKTRGKKKSKQITDTSVKENLKNEAGNDEISSVENATNQAKGNSLVQTDSKETKEIYHNEEKYNPQFLDVDVMEQIWFLPDNVHNKIQYITEIQTPTVEEIKTKRTRKKKKKSKQLSVDLPPEINPHNKVGQDLEKTNEDRIQMEEQQTDNSTVVLEKQQIAQECMDANTKRNEIISHEDIPINNDLETTLNHPTTLENPDCVFGEEFKYFIQNIDCEDTSIVPNLSAFKYEQLQRAYMAYQEKKNVAKSGNVVNKVATKNHTSERNIVRHSIENPNTMLNVYFMSTSIPNYSNGNCIAYLDETNTVNGMAKVSEECQIKERNLEAVNRITENSVPAVLEDTSNVINIHSSPKFSEETSN